MARAEQFISLTMALRKCATEHNKLCAEVAEIKSNYTGSAKQKAQLKALEQKFIKLNIKTGLLKQQANQGGKSENAKR